MSKHLYLAFEDTPVDWHFDPTIKMYNTEFVGIGRTLKYAVQLLDMMNWDSFHDPKRMTVCKETTDNERLISVLRRSIEEVTEVGFIENNGRHHDYDLVWYNEYTVAGRDEEGPRTYKYYVIREPVMGRRGLKKLRRELWPDDPHGYKG